MSSKNISVEVQSLIDAQDNPFALIDENYNIVAANTAYKQACDFTEQDIAERKCFQVSHRYDYPANVRELRSILRIAAPLSTDGIITAQEIRLEDSAETRNASTATHLVDDNGHEPSLKSLESLYIAELLAEHLGKRSTVAQILGISERTLYRKLKQYGLQSIGKAG